MRDLISWLGKANLLMGAVVVLAALIEFKVDRSDKTPLYIALAIIVVGPVEDLLNKLLDQIAIPENQRQLYKKMVDQLTSLIFLILLGFIVIDQQIHDKQKNRLLT
ncbi:MAG: hypothetical protein H0Z35_00050 [Thermoanaerobacteraceae bacterium]|nr:hypothetical protein [Thermoanaerobacteraceae bacterium]